MRWETARKVLIILGLVFMGLSGWSAGLGHMTLSWVLFTISIACLVPVVDNWGS